MKLNLRLTEDNIGDIIHLETDDKFSLDGEILSVSENSIEVKEIKSHNLFTIFLFEIKNLVVVKSKNNDQKSNQIQVPLKTLGPGSFLKVTVETEMLLPNQYDHPIFGKLTRNEIILNFCKLNIPKFTVEPNTCQFIVINTPDNVYKDCISFFQGSALIGVSFYDSYEQNQYKFVVLTCISFTMIVDLIGLDSDQIISNYPEILDIISNEKYLKLVYGGSNIFFFISIQFRAQLNNFIDLQIMHYGLHNIRVTEPLREPFQYADMVELLFNVSFKIKGNAYFTDDDALNKLAFNSHFLIPMYELMLNRLLDPVKAISSRLCRKNMDEFDGDTHHVDLNLVPRTLDNFATLPKSMQFWIYCDTTSVLQAKKTVDNELHIEKQELSKKSTDVIEINKGIVEKQEKKEKIGMTYHEELSESENEEVEAFGKANLLWRQEQPNRLVTEEEVMVETVRKVVPIFGIGRGRGRPTQGLSPGLKEDNVCLLGANKKVCVDLTSESDLTSISRDLEPEHSQRDIACPYITGSDTSLARRDNDYEVDNVDYKNDASIGGDYDKVQDDISMPILDRDPSSTNNIDRWGANMNCIRRGNMGEINQSLGRGRCMAMKSHGTDNGNDNLGMRGLVKVSQYRPSLPQNNSDRGSLKWDSDSLGREMKGIRRDNIGMCPSSNVSNIPHIDEIVAIKSEDSCVNTSRLSIVPGDCKTTTDDMSDCVRGNKYTASDSSRASGGFLVMSDDENIGDAASQIKLHHNVGSILRDRPIVNGGGSYNTSVVCPGGMRGRGSTVSNVSDMSKKYEDGVLSECSGLNDADISSFERDNDSSSMADNRWINRRSCDEQMAGMGRGLCCKRRTSPQVGRMRGAAKVETAKTSPSQSSLQNKSCNEYKESDRNHLLRHGRPLTGDLGAGIITCSKGRSPLKVDLLRSNMQDRITRHASSHRDAPTLSSKGSISDSCQMQLDMSDDVQSFPGGIKGLGRGLSPLKNLRPSMNGYDDLEHNEECVIKDDAAHKNEDFCDVPQFSWNKNRVGKLSLDSYSEELVHSPSKSEAQDLLWSDVSIRDENLTEDLYKQFGLT